MAGVEWRNVYSSNINKVGYDFDSDELLVEWSRSGRISAYGPDFPYVEFDKLSKSVSVGSIVKNKIIPQFSHHYLT